MYKQEIYLHENVSTTKLLKFLKNEQSINSEIHSFQLYQNNELLASVALPPYTTLQQGQLYSLSKSFTSTAIGIACDMGIVKTSDRVVDIFKEEAPLAISEQLSKLTVHHLLSMNTGHEACTMPSIAQSTNGVKAFFENEIKYTPGTHFTYNTGATYMLSAIITKLTGMTLLDFLSEKLWQPLAITPIMWQQSGGAISEGGIGLYLSCEDISKLGLLYLNKGQYNGKRILSAKWVEEAQKPHSDNSVNGTPDWSSGYGYQFWKNANEGYRGDGAFGQYCLILPDSNIVFSALTETWNMQDELTEIFRYLKDFKKAEKETLEIKQELDKFYLPYHSNCNTLCGLNRTYKLENNLQGFTSITPKWNHSTLILELSNGETIQTITAGNGTWIENSVIAPAFKPTLIGLSPKLRVDTDSRKPGTCRMNSRKYSDI